MRIIDTKILSGDNHPQLKVLEKLYVVDDRKATFDKIQEAQENDKLSAKEKEMAIFELSLGKKETAEIMALDLSVQDYSYLTYCVMGAITGEDPDELVKEAKARKN